MVFALTRFPFLLSLAVGLSLLLAFSCTAAAAELRLSNGDSIQGEFLRREPGKIYFHSPILGLIVAPADKAIVVESETPVESLAGIPPVTGETGIASAPANAGRRVRPWHGVLELGYQQQSGREDSIDGSIRGTAERKAQVNDYRAEARLLYGEQDDKASSDRYDALFRWRRQVSRRTFAQSQTSFTRDRIKGIDQSYEENIGFGFRLYESLRQSSNIGAGITAQYREALGVESGISYLGEAFQDYTFRLSGRLTFEEDASFVYSLGERSRPVVINDRRIDGGQDYRVRFNAALLGKITEQISINLRFEYEFDSSIPDPSARTDKRITTSVGYGF